MHMLSGVQTSYLNDIYVCLLIANLTLYCLLQSQSQERLHSELEQLKLDIWRVGDPTKPEVLFGDLFDDEFAQQHYEGLAATLKAAKKRNICTYKSPLLLKGAHDKVMITLIDTTPIGSKSDNLNELKSSGVEVKDNLTKAEASTGNMYTYKFDG